jgi:hypothetical protein
MKEIVNKIDKCVENKDLFTKLMAIKDNSTTSKLSEVYENYIKNNFQHCKDLELTKLITELFEIWKTNEQNIDKKTEIHTLGFQTSDTKIIEELKDRFIKIKKDSEVNQF